MDCLHTHIRNKNIFVPIDVAGLRSYFHKFYENNIKNLHPNKVLYILNCPSQEHFVYICSYLAASRINYVCNYHKSIFSKSIDRMFLSISSPLAIATIINTIGCVSFWGFQHVIPSLLNTTELEEMKQTFPDYTFLESWDNYFTCLHDLNILPAGKMTKDFEGSSWYLLTALKSETDDFPAINESSVCIISNIGSWNSNDEKTCSIIQRGNYLPLTHDKSQAVTCNYYEINKTQHDFEANILSNYSYYKIKDMNDDHVYINPLE